MATVTCSDQAWIDMSAFTRWAIDSGLDDARVIAICELFLQFRDAVEAEDKAAASGDVH